MLDEPNPTPEEIQELIKPPKLNDTPAQSEGRAPVDAGAPSVPAKAPTEGQAEVTGQAKQDDPQAPAERYQSQLQALMNKARAAREEQMRGQDPTADLLKRLEIAKQMGPDAVLKTLGVEREKIDIEKILGTKKEDPQAEIKQKIEQLDSYIKNLEVKQKQEEELKRKEQFGQWESQELQRISGFIKETGEKYQYVGAASDIGSDRDIYNGMISLYNQGYRPQYEEIADLVESRIEQLIDLVSGTKKFSDYLGKKFGVKLSGQKPSPTITEELAGEPSEEVDFSKMTDEENRAYSLKQAKLVMEAERRKLRAMQG